MSQPLANGTAWITGGGRGIGRAVALALADAGARVVVSARTEADVQRVAAAIAARGHEALAIVCDVADPDSVQSAFDAAVTACGRVDVLINNAGFAESAPLSRTDPDLWHKTIAINLNGTYYCTRAALGPMVARRAGRVINIASVAGRVGFRYTAAYCAAKHGVLGFTRAVALEVAGTGVTVNAICPGWTDTGMTAASIERIVRVTGRSADDARRQLELMNPLRRLIQPEEVAALTVFLAGPGAAAITGQAYNVDGGEVMA
jgi:NAD(P)-dependent dehydrogenase (short-subunit alcohol dehydrogenase family)